MLIICLLIILTAMTNQTMSLNVECAQGEFSCPQITDGSPGQCHPVDNLCDLIIDCLGGWDEAESTCGNCPKHLVHCKVEGKDSCIQSFQVCDDQVDCDGNWDEEINLCPCRGLEILCPSGICVGIQQSLCNGRENECGELDNFDEELCGSCSLGRVQCPRGTCIDTLHICDGVDHCGDGWDEKICRDPWLINQVIPDTCRQGEVICPDRRCVIKSAICEEYPSGCEDMGVDNAGACSVCKSESYVACPGTSRCIPSDSLCDDKEDCSGGWDESGTICPCLLDEFQCPSGRCLHYSKVCDGTSNCGSSHESLRDWDERNCDDTVLYGTASCDFVCPKSKVCLSSQNLCDGIHHCPDSWDEEVCRHGTASVELEEEAQHCDELETPCEHGGSCVQGSEDYWCACAANYRGLRCELSDHCRLEDLCLNGGWCLQRDYYFTCVCESFFTGINCESAVHCLSDNPCPSGSSCIQTLSDYTCYCSDGTSGETCDTIVPEIPVPSLYAKPRQSAEVKATEDFALSVALDKQELVNQLKLTWILLVALDITFLLLVYCTGNVSKRKSRKRLHKELENYFDRPDRT